VGNRKDAPPFRVGEDVTIIRSKNIADAYRKQFEILWKAAKK